MNEPKWIKRPALEILHAQSLKEHGGLEGLRDEGLLESALARPVNLHLYEQWTDMARLAAAYGFGLARNHPFFDGNKRIAFIAVALFLALNGAHLKAGQVDAYEMMIKLAAGDCDEAAFAAWIKANIKTA